MPGNPALAAPLLRDPPVVPAAPAQPGDSQQGANPSSTPTTVPAAPPPGQPPPQTGQAAPPPGPSQGAAPGSNGQPAPDQPAKPGSGAGPAGTANTSPDGKSSDKNGSSSDPDKKSPGDSADPSTGGHAKTKGDRHKHPDDGQHQNLDSKNPNQDLLSKLLPSLMRPGGSPGSGGGRPEANAQSSPRQAAPAQAQSPPPQMPAQQAYPGPLGRPAQPDAYGSGNDSPFRNVSYSPPGPGGRYASLTPPGNGNGSHTIDAADAAAKRAEQRKLQMDRIQNDLDDEFERYQSDHKDLHDKIEEKKTEADRAMQAARREGADSDEVDRNLVKAHDALKAVEDFTNESGEQAKKHGAAMRHITEELGHRTGGPLLWTDPRLGIRLSTIMNPDEMDIHDNYGQWRNANRWTGAHQHNGDDVYNKNVMSREDLARRIPLYSPFDGTVTRSESNVSGYGGLFEVTRKFTGQDGQEHTLVWGSGHEYANGLPRQGAQLSAGELAGYMGSTDVNGRPHSHTYFKLDGQFVNPRYFLLPTTGTQNYLTSN